MGRADIPVRRSAEGGYNDVLLRWRTGMSALPVKKYEQSRPVGPHVTCRATFIAHYY